MSNLYLQYFHAYDNIFAYDDYSFSKEEIDKALDEFIYPKPSKQTFFAKTNQHSYYVIS